MLIQKKRGKLIVEIFALSVMKVAMALVFPILSLRISPNIFICLFMPTTIFILIPDIYKYNCSKLLQSKVPCLLCELILLQRFYFNLGTNTKKIKESKEHLRLNRFFSIVQSIKVERQKLLLKPKTNVLQQAEFCCISLYLFFNISLVLYRLPLWQNTFCIYAIFYFFLLFFTLHKCVSLFKRK